MKNTEIKAHRVGSKAYQKELFRLFYEFDRLTKKLAEKIGRFESFTYRKLLHLITNILIQIKGVKIHYICPRNRAFLLCCVFLVDINRFEPTDFL